MYTRLEIEMRRKNVSIKHLSDLTGIPYATLGKKLRGAVSFTVKEAFVIRDALNSEATIDTLFRWEE